MDLIDPPPAAHLAPVPRPAPVPADPAERVRVPGGFALAVFFGVLLPCAALFVELGTGMCRGLFDPIPTRAHVAAVALVPVAHLLALLAIRPGSRVPLRLASWLNGAALAVGLAYAAGFAPITPIAFVMIIAMGLGLLPLAPLASVIAALCLRAALRRRAAADGVRRAAIWPGFVAGLLALVALEAPALVTALGVEKLSRGDAAEQADGLRLLRRFGDETQLLAGSYSQFNDRLITTPLKSLSGNATVEDYQLAYYRVTGRLYNSVPAPLPAGAFRGRDRSPQETEAREWVWDASLGEQRVGQRLRGLNLVESRLDARLESDAALGYVEWTLEFRNDHVAQQREARALVQLPPGAVVSRLTLWVHGEEREATFAGRAQVVQAYRNVVVRERRDPVLVTTQGADRVLVQCFPVEPGGGLMKLRLGITTPLPLSSADRAHFVAPRFIEQNFSVGDDFAHQVWIEADAPLSPSASGLSADSALARPTVRGALPPSRLADSPVLLSLSRRPDIARVWSPGLRDPHGLVEQTLRRVPAPAGPRALVVSGSGELAPAAEALADALEKAGGPTPFAVIHVAGDRLETSPAGLDSAGQARWLRARKFVGGQDDADALAAALDGLAGRPDATLVWLHGAQPVAWRDATRIEQTLARARPRLRIVAVSAVAGPNLLLEKISAAAPVTTFPRLSALPDDLSRLLRELREGSLVAIRERRAAGPEKLAARETDERSVRASDHLSRLETADAVRALLARGDAASRAQALALAVDAQIVTPVSGAVVLETLAQYKAAGLEPGDPMRSPAMPEPASASALCACAALGFALCRRRPHRRG